MTYTVIAQIGSIKAVAKSDFKPFDSLSLATVTVLLKDSATLDTGAVSAAKKTAVTLKDRMHPTAVNGAKMKQVVAITTSEPDKKLIGSGYFYRIWRGEDRL